MYYNSTSRMLLSAPFPVDKLKFRVGSVSQDMNMGMPLTYIDARDVYTRLDDVLGPENWQTIYQVEGNKTTCELMVRVSDEEWISKSNGAGDTDFEGEKGAYSDAIKRAAVLVGVGAYLYDCKLPWKSVEHGGAKSKKTAYFSERVIEELKELMRNKYGEVNTAENVVKFDSGGYENDVGINVTEAKKRWREVAAAVESVTKGSDLVNIVQENMDLLGKLYDYDRRRSNIQGNINWYISNGDEHEHVSLRDRIVKKAFDISTDVCSDVLGLLKERKI